MVYYDREKNREKLFDSTGRMLTIGLFKETYRKDSSVTPHFSLSDWHTRYIELNDPTEYKPAMELLGSWEHWKKLRENETLAAILDGWKAELEVKLRSEAIGHLIEQAADPKGTAAARWLAEYNNDKPVKRPVGRPKDAGANDENVLRNAEADINKKTLEDAERLGLVVVKGGK